MGEITRYANLSVKRKLYPLLEIKKIPGFTLFKILDYLDLKFLPAVITAKLRFLQIWPNTFGVTI